MGELLLAGVFGFLTLVSAVLVIRAKNPVYSVLFLILVFCNTAGLLLLVGLDFFALVFLIVYVGAIAVLFLFVVMMLNVKVTEVQESVFHYLPIGGFVGLVFLLEVACLLQGDLVPFPLPSTPSTGLGPWPLALAGGLAVVRSGGSPEVLARLERLTSAWALHAEADLPLDYLSWPTFALAKPPIEVVGQVLYTAYVGPFLGAGLILLVAMLGAIMLTLETGRPVKRQRVFEQNARDPATTVAKIRTFA